MSEYTNPHEFLMALLRSADLPKRSDFLAETILRILYYRTEAATSWASLPDISATQDSLASALSLLHERKFIVSLPFISLMEYYVASPETWANERDRVEFWLDLFAFVDKEGNVFRNFDPWRRDVSHKLRFTVFRRDRFTCQYCGRKPPEVVLHCDHKHPSSKGGLTIPWNLITSCQECNLGKGVAAIQ